MRHIPRARFLAFCMSISILTAVPCMTEDTASSDNVNPRMVVYSLLRDALDSFEQSDLDHTQLLLDSILAIDSVNSDGLYLKAKLAIARGDSISATEILEYAARIIPRSTRIKLLLARLYLAQGNGGECQALTDSVLAVKPSDAESLYLQGRCVLQQGDTARANDIFENVLSGELGEGDQ